MFEPHPIWPMPSLDGHSPRVVNPSSRMPGVDIAYARPIRCSLPALAVADGVIAYAGRQLHNHAIVIDHENGWSTYYANLAHMFATPTPPHRRTVRVRAGDVLGYVGAPTPGDSPRLHFELWRLGRDLQVDAVDPRHYMSAWLVLPWTNHHVAA